jgi:hypothetical protein
MILKRKLDPDRINRAVKACHKALLKRDTFTADEAWDVIAEVTGVPKKTAQELFAIMRIMGAILDGPEGSKTFYAAAGRYKHN